MKLKQFSLETVGHCAVSLVASAVFLPLRHAVAEPPQESVVNTPMVAMAYNDLGMHCMNADFSELLILPPFNTVHVQVIHRGESPQLVHENVGVRYFIPGNSHGIDRSNFWKYPILGNIPLDVGVTGHRLSGTMTPTQQEDWIVTGIPIVPIDDTGRENAYAIATIEVTQGVNLMARTQTVLPVSTEMSCHLCHNTPRTTVAADILQKHDRLHGTSLMAQRPVLCAQCHADNALGLPGEPDVSNLSAAMHASHASRVESLTLAEACYACHPGVRTNCQRDIHFLNGIGCVQCHGDMEAVGDPTRQPWIDEPRCGNCHNRAGFEFEPPGTLFRNAQGHGKVHCYACHGSPHAITPASTEKDNAQAIAIQGHAGVINTCVVCHVQTPEDSFFHRQDD